MENDKKKSHSKVLLTQKLVSSLVGLNKDMPNALWNNDSESEDMENAELRSEHHGTILKIVETLGLDIFEDIIDIRNTSGNMSMYLHEFRWVSFEIFITTANHEIEVQLGVYDNDASRLPDYEVAHELLCGMTYLLNTSDQFFAKVSADSDYKVLLKNPFRAYLHRILIAAQLQDMVSDTLFDTGADAGEQSYDKPYQICDQIFVDDLCNDLNVVENFIKSMCKIRDKFVFDIDEIVDGNARSRMSLSDFVRYECEHQLKM